MRGRVLVTVGALGALAILVFGACGTDGNDVGGCQELEGIRCGRAIGCGIDIGSLPIHYVSGGTSQQEAQDIQACDLYYEDACIHGFLTPVAIKPQQVTDCADALKAGPCTWIYYPQLSPACSWLIPPDGGTGVDSGTVTDAGDAGTDGDTGQL